MSYFLTIVKRDLLLIARHPSEMAIPLVFFVLVIALFPLAVSPDPSLLSQAAAGVVWVAALLATLLSLDLMFKEDFVDGSLEQLLISSEADWLLVLAKVFVHWVISGLPLVVLAPVVSSMLFLPDGAAGALALSLFLGTPTLSLFGALGAALVLGLKNSGMLISLLVLPLYIPVLIFGAGGVAAASLGMPINGYIAYLGALLIFALLICPFGTAAALKISQMQS